MLACARTWRSRLAPWARLRPGLLALLLAWAGGVAGQGLQATGAQVKAAYLLKFPGFVEWPAPRPAEPEAAFVVAVLDADDVLAALRELASGTRVMGRPVQVVSLPRDEPTPPAQLVFVGAAAHAPAAWVARARTQGALVVGDGPQALAQGAALQFLDSEGRVRFAASPDNAARSGLKLGARLLSVAARVEGGAP